MFVPGNLYWIASGRDINHYQRKYHYFVFTDFYKDRIRGYLLCTKENEANTYYIVSFYRDNKYLALNKCGSDGLDFERHCAEFRFNKFAKFDELIERLKKNAKKKRTR